MTARVTMLLLIPWVWALLLHGADAVPQSNYGIQENDIEYTKKDGLPATATLAGKVTELDTLAPQIKLNRTSASLNCADGSMKIHLSFQQPFYGIAYSDFDRSSACFAQGTGTDVVTMELPLKGCGTRQDPQRVFTNNIIVRFHPGLEMEGDEIITIVCRYPPPIVAIPPAPFLAPDPILPGPLPKPLREFEILLIICAILFLGLMLLGLGCSYYCLRHRNIQVARKRPFSAFDEDESEKQSTIESFQNLKIPRVHPPSESSSEVPIEETLGSDYPSSIEDAPHRPDTVSSEYSDTHFQMDTALIPPARVRKPEFEVNLRVAKQPETQMRYSETEGSISSIETGLARSSHIAALHPPPRKRSPPAVFSKAQAHQDAKRSVQSTEHVDMLTVVDREDLNRETRYTQPLAVRKPEVSVHNVDDVYLQTIVERRLIEDEERRTREVTQFYKKEDPKWDVVIRSHQAPEDEAEAWERGSETTDVASSIGWSAVDEPPTRLRYSTVDHELLNRRTDVTRTETDHTMTVSRAMQKLQQDDTQTWNAKWQVLLRVLESPPPPLSVNRPHSTTEDDDYTDDDTASVLSANDREKWRRIITTESTLRSLLTEATVREDYERIRRDIRYEKLFEPEKWDVIIRVLAPPPPEPTYHREDSVSEVSTVSSGPIAYRRKKSTGESTVESRKSMTDVRSMTEMMVDFAATERDDASSMLSGPGARSVADRSQSEIVEFSPMGEGAGSSLGSRHGNFRTHEQSVTRAVDEERGLVQETRATKSTFSSSRLTRF